MPDQQGAEEISRFNDLPREVREWIAHLRKEDIEEIDEARRFIRSMKTAGSIWKYAFLTFFSAIVVVGSAFEYIGRFFNWLHRPPGAP